MEVRLGALTITRPERIVWALAGIAGDRADTRRRVTGEDIGSIERTTCGM